MVGPQGMKGRLAILGGGSWGTALSVILSPRFKEIRLWVRRPDLAAEMETSRENRAYLPGFKIPPNVTVQAVASESLSGAELLLCVLPSHAVRAFFSETNLDPDLPVITATKGIEAGSLLRMSQVITEAAGSKRVAVLSGPSFAAETAAGHPTAVVVASHDLELAGSVQASFSGSTFRVYTSADPIGVELGGAYKNVVAIGAGVCHGLGLGSNAVSALITRGLAEMTRLAVKLGGFPPTLAGLAGLGDLVLTCTGSLSRNRMVGEQLAQGRAITEILGNMRMVAEGVGTTKSIVELGALHREDLPIACQMNAMLNFDRKPREAIQLLMERALRNES
jgi:glycerol-3-phosphate dehydrogenase (NAD(P)+)